MEGFLDALINFYTVDGKLGTIKDEVTKKQFYDKVCQHTKGSPFWFEGFQIYSWNWAGSQKWKEL